MTNDYNAAFHVGGALLFLTGLLFCLLHLPCIKPKNIAVPEIVVAEPEESLLRAAPSRDASCDNDDDGPENV